MIGGESISTTIRMGDEEETHLIYIKRIGLVFLLIFLVYSMLQIAETTMSADGSILVLLRNTKSQLKSCFLNKNSIAVESPERRMISNLANYKLRNHILYDHQPAEHEYKMDKKGETGINVETEKPVVTRDRDDVGQRRERGLRELESRIRRNPDSKTKEDMIRFLTEFRDNAIEWLVTSSDLRNIYRKVQKNIFKQIKAGINQTKWVPDIKERFFVHDHEVRAILDKNLNGDTKR